jgi:hypothetical protein
VVSGRCDYELRYDQTVSNLRAAIDQAEANRHSSLLVRQARVAWVVLSGKLEGDSSCRMIAITVSAADDSGQPRRRQVIWRFVGKGLAS